MNNWRPPGARPTLFRRGWIRRIARDGTPRLIVMCPAAFTTPLCVAVKKTFSFRLPMTRNSRGIGH
jgi:hypothetical protein